jgi:hypothetical protein
MIGWITGARGKRRFERDDHNVPKRTKMPTAPQRDQAKKDVEHHQRETRNNLIAEQVMHLLGTPGSLFAVQVRRLWNGFCRVNVFVGTDASAVKVANSYFLKVDGDGIIVESNPTITKQY